MAPRWSVRVPVRTGREAVGGRLADMSIGPGDERPHDGLVDEWVFAAWQPDGRAGIVSGHRLFGTRAWYWCALVEEGYPVLHLTEWDVVVRPADPFIVKAPEMWAEHHCDAPMEQWSVGNEAHFAALDDAEEGLGRAYGIPTPMATDIEWYATAEPTPLDDGADGSAGYEQVGVAHGVVELLGRPFVEFVEAPAHRWRRWGSELPALEVPSVVAHTGLRAPFSFPDGSVADWVLTGDGWRSRPRGPARAARRTNGLGTGESG